MSIPFITHDPAEHGRAMKIKSGLVRLVAPNPGPFTFTGSSTYIAGEERLAIIDPGPMNESHLDALMKVIAGRPVDVILLTHRHSDHAGLAPRLAALTRAPLMAHPTGPTKGPRLEGLSPGLMDERAADNLNIATPLADGMKIEEPGWTFEVIHTPGHTSDHCCFRHLQSEAIFTGDHVMGWSTTVIAPPEGDMIAYLANLKRLAALQPSRLIPTHGMPIEDPTPFLDALIAHRESRESQIIAALREGPQTIPGMVSRLYPDLAPALTAAAGLSVLGHLDGLMRQKRVALDGTQPLDAPFRLI